MNGIIVLLNIMSFLKSLKLENYTTNSISNLSNEEDTQQAWSKI